MSDSTIKKSEKRWQSDVIVDMVKKYKFEYIGAQSRRELSRLA